MTPKEAVLTIVRIGAIEDFAAMLQRGQQLTNFAKNTGLVGPEEVMSTLMNAYSKGIYSLLTTAQDLLTEEQLLQFEREAMNIMFKAKEKVS